MLNSAVSTFDRTVSSKNMLQTYLFTRWLNPLTFGMAQAQHVRPSPHKASPSFYVALKLKTTIQLS